ncbi:MAG TPA: 4-hydroxyphenylpyruvate dioxygenase [Acidimicrobiales bacterium]|nr:4-hydroxyphenylpyruvate dioxygenase [Acidimicrobiales bacterium]
MTPQNLIRPARSDFAEDATMKLPTRAPARYFQGWDYLEFWVGNARAFSGWLASAFGFEIVAYSGPETGSADRASYLLEQGPIRLLVCAALGPASPIADHVRAHGDGVRDLAIRVTSVSAAYDAALARGAVGVNPPWIAEDDSGKVVRATIALYGDTQHTFVERSAYMGRFLPGFSADPGLLPPRAGGPAVGLRLIDHVVANVYRGSLERWVGFYRQTLGFEQLVHFDDAQISTQYSALMSTVVWDGSRVVLPINEPADGPRKSQIQEYLECYGSPGVQHIALATDDIVASVTALRERGVRFLTVPDTYYEDARARLAGIDVPWDALQALGVLVDRDHDGYLLQIFTENVSDRPTVFFEIIQREGAKGFGAGNFKALFEAIERAQERRGHL